jgi:hypothetical protein
LIVPYDLGKTEICDLDLANTTCTNTPDKLSFVDFVFIFRRSRLWVLGWNKRNRGEQYVLRLDVSVMTSEELPSRAAMMLTCEPLLSLHVDTLMLGQLV